MPETDLDNKGNSLRRRVYYYLREKMDKGSILPGAAINLNELSKELSISKTPLRDAIIQLEAEGFVTIWPRRGIIVNTLTLDDIKYLYEVIGALEAAMVRSVFDKFSETCLAGMERLNLAMRAALVDDDMTEFSKHHWAFHDIFLELSKNIFAKRIITPIKHRLWEFPRRNFVKEWEMIACNEHQLIIDTIRVGDREKAANIIRETHWGFDYNEKFIRRIYFGEHPEN